MFEIGDKVKCIDAEWGLRGQQPEAGIECPLVLGYIYTVSGFENWPLSPLYDETTCLVLVEALNPTQMRGREGFGARRFRKLPNVKKGMATLRAIVKNSKTKVS